MAIMNQLLSSSHLASRPHLSPVIHHLLPTSSSPVYPAPALAICNPSPALLLESEPGPNMQSEDVRYPARSQGSFRVYTLQYRVDSWVCSIRDQFHKKSESVNDILNTESQTVSAINPMDQQGSPCCHNILTANQSNDSVKHGDPYWYNAC